PSAFRLFVYDRDWLGAHEIALARSAAFQTPGLQGWRAVARAYANPNEAISSFDEAATFFEADAMPLSDEERQRPGFHWSSANQQLWAKYFRARARVTESVQQPQNVRELLAEAAGALSGTDAGWHSGEVSRFHVLIRVLVGLLSHPTSFDLDR